MSSNEDNRRANFLKEAAKKIANILCELELVTGGKVYDVELVEHEITNIDDHFRRFQREVVIDLSAPPGDGWAT